MKIKSTKPDEWVLDDNKWFKFFLQKCTVGQSQYIRTPKYKTKTFIKSQCVNLVLAPGISKQSIYNTNKYQCCLNHVSNNTRYNIKGDSFKCRACWKCIDNYWKMDNNSISLYCTVNRSIHFVDPQTNSTIGDLSLYSKCQKLGMDFKLNFLKLGDGKMEYTLANKLYKERYAKKKGLEKVIL